MLVEDSPADAGLVSEALHEHAVACELIVVTDGERAIQFIDDVDRESDTCPDLVILDLNLPKRSGKDVLRHMRASSKCNHIPVLILTSSDSQKDKDETASLGASRYIRKPSRLADFMALGGLFKQMLSGPPNA